MATRRLFIAIPLPDSVRKQLTSLYEPIRGIVWTRPEQLHLTLRFLGEVDESLVAPLEDSLTTVRVEPFLLPVEGTGSFPLRGPARVVWVGIGAGHPRLYQLRQQLDDALLSTSERFIPMSPWRG